MVGCCPSHFKRGESRNNIFPQKIALYSYGKSCTVEVGAQHGVVALSTLITHIICIILGNFNLEGDTMVYLAMLSD